MNFSNTEANQPDTLPSIVKADEPPKGLGWDANKPLMRMREGNPFPSPIGNTEGNTFFADTCGAAEAAFTTAEAAVVALDSDNSKFKTQNSNLDLPLGLSRLTLNQNLLAEEISCACRRFRELTADGALSGRQAAAILEKPLNWFSGANCYLEIFTHLGPEALAGGRAASSDNSKFTIHNLELPEWFLRAARFFYLLSDHRRDGGSVPEAILRTIALPAVPFGWTQTHAHRLAKLLDSDNSKLKTQNSELALPSCPSDLRELILSRYNSRKPIVPKSIAKLVALAGAIIERSRAPREFSLNNLSASGSQRRYYHAANAQRQIMEPGDWFGGDDATPGIAVCVPTTEIDTPSSQKFGVLLGRFQWLAANDCRTDKILAHSHVIRPRASYRGEDILDVMAATVKLHGIPRRGFQFEGGNYNCKLVRQAIELLHCEHWRTYSPHAKAIESVFNRVWTRLAVQFPHANLGRFRNALDENCKLYETCKRGHQDPRKYFPTLDLVVKAFDQEVAAHNAKQIVSRQYGSWVPDVKFHDACSASPLRSFTASRAWIFSPHTAERKIVGMNVGCEVRIFEDFSVPFDFSAPWLPLHRGKRVRLHFNPREPRCQAMLVLLEDSGTHRAGDILGAAQLIGETAQHVRRILDWAKDDQRAGYKARQQTAQYLTRLTRAVGQNGRVEYALHEHRDGLGSLAKIEAGQGAPRTPLEMVGQGAPGAPLSRSDREKMSADLKQRAANFNPYRL